MFFMECLVWCCSGVRENANVNKVSFENVTKHVYG